MHTPLYQKVSSVFAYSVLIGVLIMVLIRPGSFTSWQGIREIWPSILMSVLYTFVLGEGNGYLNDYVDRWIRWIDQPVKRLLVGIGVMFLYTVIAILFVEFIVAKLVWEARCQCTLTWNDYYLSNLYLPLVITIIITTVLSSRKFLLEWRRSAIEAERLKSEYLASQYQSLKDQVNPHFLFNSLNALTYLVYEDQDQATQFIKKLAEVYRYVLDTREREAVPLSEELDFVRSYVFLQQIRFEDSLRVTINVPEETSYQIPPLALQMLLENAVKHNELSDECSLRITISVEGDTYLVVQNNVQPKEIRESSSGIGLANIRARYAYLTDKGVVINDDPPYFTVKLPLLRTEPSPPTPLSSSLKIE